MCPAGHFVRSHRSESHAPPHAYDAALLIPRLALGFLLVGHGTQKLFRWFGGGGLEGTGQFFTMVGYPSGKTMALVAGLSETLGGLGLALGLLTPLAGAAVLGTMLNAMSVNSGGGFFMMDKDGGMELDILVAATATGLALAGPGRIAADRFLPVLRAHRLGYGVAAVVLGAAAGGASSCSSSSQAALQKFCRQLVEHRGLIQGAAVVRSRRVSRQTKVRW